jgi:hypothetical protein
LFVFLFVFFFSLSLSLLLPALYISSFFNGCLQDRGGILFWPQIF